MSNAISVIDSDAIVEARVRGESIRSIAKRLKVSITDIHDTLDRFAKVTISQNLRTHTLALELERLDNLQQAYEQQARAGDIQAAMLVAKLIERRCIMLGLSAPPRVDPQIIEQQTAPTQTSTERIRAAIDRIRSLPKPEAEQDNQEQPRDTHEDKPPQSN